MTMVDLTDKCKANETAACCGVDIGTIIDNNDCSVPYEALFTTEKEATDALTKLTKIARDIESDPCQITHKVTPVGDGFQLSANFNFSCGAESMIFQFKLR